MADAIRAMDQEGSFEESVFAEGLAQSLSEGRFQITSLPRLADENVGLVTIWNEHGGELQVFRSVFERRAPESLARIEKLLDPGDRIGQGNNVRHVSDEVLAAMTEAYREAVKRGVTV